MTITVTVTVTYNVCIQTQTQIHLTQIHCELFEAKNLPTIRFVRKQKEIRASVGAVELRVEPSHMKKFKNKDQTLQHSFFMLHYEHENTDDHVHRLVNINSCTPELRNEYLEKYTDQQLRAQNIHIAHDHTKSQISYQLKGKEEKERKKRKKRKKRKETNSMIYNI